MGPEPTLRCPCGESNFAEALHYETAPRGEIQFSLVGEYRRYYDRCTTCGHYFSRHNLDMGALYKGDYLTVTYGGAKGIEEAFKRISNLPAEKSDNFQFRVAIFKQNSSVKKHMSTLKIKIEPGSSISIIKNL